MTHSNINTLKSSLCYSPINKPIILYSTYIRNKHKDLDCDYWKKYLFDGYGYIEFDTDWFSDIIYTHQNTYRLIMSNIFDPLNPYNITLSSETLSAITSITNKYLADKRIYIPVSLEKPNYYYLVARGRGSGKSIRELCYVAKVISNYSSHMISTVYSSEYKTQNYKSDMENLYKDKIFHKALDYYLTNIHHNQRSNNKEEMSCFKLIANRNNTNKKFHK